MKLARLLQRRDPAPPRAPIGVLPLLPPPRVPTSREAALAKWRDAAECVREEHADLHDTPLDSPLRGHRYDCLLAALRIEAACADELKAALDA